MKLYPLKPSSGSAVGIRIYFDFAGGANKSGKILGYTMENLCDYLNLK